MFNGTRIRKSGGTVSDGRSGVGRERRTDVRCRLLYLVGQLRAGGSERQLVYLLGQLDRARYRPEVAVWNFDTRDAHVTSIQRLGVPLHAGPQGGSRLVKLMWFRRLVRELRPEVIHSYSFFTNFAAFFAASGTDAIVVGSRRSDFVLEVWTAGPLVGMLCAHLPRTHISNSSVAARSTHAWNRFFSTKRLLVVRNGIDLASFRPWPHPQSRPVEILAVGSLTRVKRWDRLLDCAYALKARGLDLRIRLVGEGPLRQELESRAFELGLGELIHFVGYTSDVQGLFASSAFLAHTSDAEGCPNVILEAMACSRAVVTTDVGETPQLVEDGKTGFVIPRANRALFTERLDLLIRDQKLCRRMGEAGRVKAEREFGLDRLVAETLEAYRAFGWQG